MPKSFALFLGDILNQDLPLPVDNLGRLSDMDADAAEAFSEAWPAIPVHRRRELMRRLADICQEDFSVDFAPVALLGIRDPDSLVRLAALDIFWDAENPALVRPVLRLMEQDPDVAVRANSAQALGQFVLLGELGKLSEQAYSHLTQALLAVIRDETADTLVRCRAIESAAVADLEEISEVIGDAYRSSQEPFRASAVSAMGRTGDESWRPIVLRELESISPSMRFHAAMAAGQLGLSEAVQSLVGLLDDPDPAVMRSSIWSLGEIGGAEARRALEHLRVDAELGELVEEAIDAIDLATGTSTMQLRDWGP